MKKIPMLERFAAQSLVESDGELVFSKEKFAELIVRDCALTAGLMEHEGRKNIGAQLLDTFEIEH